MNNWIDDHIKNGNWIQRFLIIFSVIFFGIVALVTTPALVLASVVWGFQADVGWGLLAILFWGAVIVGVIGANDSSKY